MGASVWKQWQPKARLPLFYAGGKQHIVGAHSTPPFWTCAALCQSLCGASASDVGDPPLVHHGCWFPMASSGVQLMRASFS